LLGISQQLNNGFDSIKFRIIDKRDGAMGELRDCPALLRLYFIRQSNAIGEFYKAIHPVKSKVLTMRRRFLFILVKPVKMLQGFLSNINIWTSPDGIEKLAKDTPIRLLNCSVHT